MLNPAGLLSLDHRLDVFSTASDGHIWSATSFDDGQTWAVDWTLVDAGIGSLSEVLGPAAAGSGDGRVTHLVARSFNTGDERMWFLTTANYHTSWAGGVPIGSGTFVSGPAIATSGDGQVVYVVGRGSDARMWYAKSTNGASSWTIAWLPIGAGVFVSGPAAAVSADGSHVFVFGLGTDHRIWWARSFDGASTWNVAWAPIPVGTFQSDPAAAVSADGQTVYVFGRGLDNKFYLARSSNGGNTWSSPVSSEPIGAGTFISGPAVATSWNGQRVHVFGQGTDNRVWRAASFDGAASWSVAWAPIGNKTFP